MASYDLFDVHERRPVCVMCALGRCDECVGRGKEAPRLCACLCDWLLEESDD